MKVRCFQLPRYVEKGNAQAGELVLERSHLIDAAIVKVMKSKRIVQYAELISEVQKMCKTFKAEVGMIKKRIENCQEREFLERDPDDMNTLIYKPWYLTDSMKNFLIYALIKKCNFSGSSGFMGEK